MEERLSRIEAMLDSISGTGMRPQAGTDCIDFSAYPPSPTPNPLTIQGATFFAQDHLGAPWPNPGIKNYGAFTGLDCGFRLDIDMPKLCQRVDVTLAHYSTPAQVVAYNADGSVAGTAIMSGPQNIAETLSINGTNIQKVVIVAPQNETLLLKICCVSRPWKFWKEWKEFKEKPEPKEFKEKREPKEFKDFKEKPEPFENWGYGLAQPTQPIQPEGGSALEARLAQLEAALAQMMHFIRPEMRPDLSTGALKQEADYGTGMGGKSWSQ
jgi:hypothetical protein